MTDLDGHGPASPARSETARTAQDTLAAWADGRRRRLAAAGLAQRAPADELLPIVRDLCGMQAQMPTAAELAISARVEGLTQTDVRREISETRSLVRIWTVRGTIHLLPTTDLPLWVAILGPRDPAEAWYRYRSDPIPPADLERYLQAALDALANGPLSRAEIAGALTDRFGPAIAPLLDVYHGDLLGPLSWRGLVCFAPSAGSPVRFVRIDRWLGRDLPSVDTAEAWRTLVLRFIRAYGPIATADVARWFGVRVPVIAAVVAELRGGLESAVIDGSPVWTVGSGDVVAPPDGLPTVRLLPQYDPYVLGSLPRGSIVGVAAMERIRGSGRGPFEGLVGVPVLTVDGEVVGIWTRRTTGRRLTIAVEPSIRLDAVAIGRLEAEVDRIGRFLGLDAELDLVEAAAR